VALLPIVRMVPAAAVLVVCCQAFQRFGSSRGRTENCPSGSFRRGWREQICCGRFCRVRTPSCSSSVNCPGSGAKMLLPEDPHEQCLADDHRLGLRRFAFLKSAAAAAAANAFPRIPRRNRHHRRILTIPCSESPRNHCCRCCCIGGGRGRLCCRLPGACHPHPNPSSTTQRVHWPAGASMTSMYRASVQ